MLGLGYAAVPLYNLFCSVTGFGGTTQRASESDADRRAVRAQPSTPDISIRFDASTAVGMPWTFSPEASKIPSRSASATWRSTTRATMATGR